MTQKLLAFSKAARIYEKGFIASKLTNSAETSSVVKS
jgi:hypothetical protein